MFLRRVATQVFFDMEGSVGRAGTPVALSFSYAGLVGLPPFAFEGVFGTLAGLGEIAIGAILQRIGTTMSELAVHRIVAGLAAFVGFLRAFTAIGIVLEVVANTFRHMAFRSLCCSSDAKSEYAERRVRAIQ